MFFTAFYSGRIILFCLNDILLGLITVFVVFCTQDTFLSLETGKVYSSRYWLLSLFRFFSFSRIFHSPISYITCQLDNYSAYRTACKTTTPLTAPRKTTVLVGMLLWRHQKTIILVLKLKWVLVETLNIKIKTGKRSYQIITRKLLTVTISVTIVITIFLKAERRINI